MKIYESSMLRNVGIFGHGSTGKTSLAEAMLFNTGMITRLGRVEDGNTIMDFEPEEIKKTSSISAGFGFVVLKNGLINIVDTPGDTNFISDSKNALCAVDCAILTLCAASGVEVQTEKVWELTDELELPKIIFINKMDRERADFYNVLNEIKDTFKVSLLPLQIPIGKEDSFEGVVDLITQKAYHFDDQGKPVVTEIPSDMTDQVEEYRVMAIEAIAENDEELMDKYLEGEELPSDKVTAVLTKALASGEIIPVLCGSATKTRAFPYSWIS